LSFTQKTLGVDLCVATYSQIVVRDYVSGAMEHTSGYTHGEFLNVTTRADRRLMSVRSTIDMNVSQWFGDLVTCESWSNLKK